MNRIRAFLAIELPASIKQEIQSFQNVLRENTHGISWVKSSNLHITLKFLGDIDSGQQQAISAILPDICLKSAPFSIRIEKTGFFPNANRPRILWVGCSDSEHQLEHIFTSIDRALTDIGFTHENRPFSPHLTIGRVKQPHSMGTIVTKMQKSTDFSAGQFQASAVKLIKSQLHPGGARYTPLAVFQLGK